MKVKYLLISMIIWCACSTDEIEIKDLSLDDRQIVVYAELSPDRPIQVYVSRPQSRSDQAFSFDQLVLSDAMVSVTVDDRTEDLIYVDSTMSYMAPRNVRSGATYQVQVIHQDYPMAVSAPVLVPQIPQMEIDSTRREIDQSKCGNERIKCLTFTIEESGYYSFVSHNSCQFSINKSEENCGMISGTEYPNILTSSCLIDGPLEAEQCGFYFQEDHWLLFNCHSWSEEAYTYYQSLQEAEALYEGFVEPKETYSNIENGYGVVMGVATLEIKY